METFSMGIRIDRKATGAMRPSLLKTPRQKEPAEPAPHPWRIDPQAIEPTAGYVELEDRKTGDGPRHLDDKRWVQGEIGRLDRELR
jgi:hypothetical protein